MLCRTRGVRGLGAMRSVVNTAAAQERDSMVHYVLSATNGKHLVVSTRSPNWQPTPTWAMEPHQES